MSPAFAESLQMPLRVVATSELERPEYQRNDANPASLQRRALRCHGSLGAELGFAQIAYGMNADDTRDYRPASAPPSNTPFSLHSPTQA